MTARKLQYDGNRNQPLAYSAKEERTADLHANTAGGAEKQSADYASMRKDIKSRFRKTLAYLAK